LFAWPSTTVTLISPCTRERSPIEQAAMRSAVTVESSPT
jgi:hypothetical protein